MPEEKEIGKVTHFFNRISVAAIRLTGGGLKVGDTIRVKGATSDFTQRVDSMQVERESIESAGPGQEIGIKTVEPARQNDTVYLVTE